MLKEIVQNLEPSSTLKINELSKKFSLSDSFVFFDIIWFF